MPACAWPFVVSPTTNNVLLPAGSATYWATLLVPGGPWQALLDATADGLEIVGHFPAARYFSFEVNSLSGTVTDTTTAVLYDAQIQPDEAGTNPAITAGAPPGGTYRIRVVVAGSPAADRAAALGSNVNVITLPSSGGVTILYRVYGPTPPSDAAGGVPLPSFVRRFAGVVDKPATTCPWAMKNGTKTSALYAPIDVLVGAAAARTAAPFDPAPTPALARPKAERLGGLFAGAQNAYLSAFVALAPGKLAVWQAASSPVYPNTQAGAAIPPPRDVRYFSLCMYKYASPYPLINGGCGEDSVLRPSATAGPWTVVSGAPADKPSDAALAAAGAVWVPALNPGDDPATTPILTVFRTILPAVGYTSAVQSVPADGSPASAATAMGATYPVGSYCDKATFEAAGLAGSAGTGR